MRDESGTARTVLVLGGDGFCGWPTALHLSAQGYDVVVVDNMERRQIDVEIEAESLTPIRSLTERLRAWEDVTGRQITGVRLDVANEYDRLVDLIEATQPHAIVHFAEQRAAPYSMKTERHKRYTVMNNLGTTTNVLNALVATGVDAHLVHLGTMGIYGYETTGLQIPEGYLEVTARDGEGTTSDMTIPYPPKPGSVYHATKAQDAILFDFYNRNDGVRITDLHQGIVWGTQTEETALDERLVNRFDYDGDFGTVLNRFLMQGALGYPITAYGTGGQTRAFIHIRDTVRCIRLAIENPPASENGVEVFNQATEAHQVRDLAFKVADLTDADVEFIDNPRKEKVKNALRVANDKFMDLGLDPITLANGLLQEVTEVAMRYRDRVKFAKILPTSKW